MYKITQKNSQRRADALVPKNLMDGQEILDPQAHYELLKRKIQELELKLTQTVGKSARKLLGSQKFLLQQEMSKINPRIRRDGFSQYFYEAAKRILPREVFHSVEKEAQHVWDCRNSTPNYLVDKRNEIIETKHQKALDDVNRRNTTD